MEPSTSLLTALLVTNLAGRFQAVHARHVDVHGDEVRPERPGQFDGLDAVAGLADDLDFRVAGQDLDQQQASGQRIFGDEDADHGNSG
jgi:hypothetical protein